MLACLMITSWGMPVHFYLLHLWSKQEHLQPRWEHNVSLSSDHQVAPGGICNTKRPYLIPGAHWTSLVPLFSPHLQARNFIVTFLMHSEKYLKYSWLQKNWFFCKEYFWNKIILFLCLLEEGVNSLNFPRRINNLSLETFWLKIKLTTVDHTRNVRTLMTLFQSFSPFRRRKLNECCLCI